MTIQKQFYTYTAVILTPRNSGNTSADVSLIIFKDFTLLWENVVFGFFKNPRKEDNFFFFINLIMMLAKCFIHMGNLAIKNLILLFS